MNYKVKCTGYKQSNEKYFTIGKIYDVIDNTITNDRGFTYGKVSTCESVIDYLASWYKFETVADNHKIVITTDGTETLARLYEGKKVIMTATAKCSPNDAFDFETGAEIAFNRLMGVNAVKGEKAKPHKYKAGDKVKVIANTCYHGMKIGEVVTLDKIFYTDEISDKWFTKEYKTNCYIRSNDFEPCKEEPKPTYYNGKVVCVEKGYKERTPLTVFTVGKVYEVIDGIIIADGGYKTERYHTLEELSIGLGHKFLPLVE